jgi:hypothetical protein
VVGKAATKTAAAPTPAVKRSGAKPGMDVVRSK